MEAYQFSDFLETVDQNNKEFVIELNTVLLNAGYKFEIKAAKSGFTVSYLQAKTKKTLATFVCRKSGVKLRIFPRHLQEYEAILNSFPEKMKKDIKKASVCKRLLNPDDCNPKCTMGYDFLLDNEQYQKCRYMAFMPSLNEENNPFIKLFLEKEISFQA